MDHGEKRARPRYAAHPPLPARFGQAEAQVLNLSVAGALLQHVVPFDLGSEAPLAIDDAGVALYGEVVWTKHLANDDPASWLTGVKFTEWVEVAQRAIERLVTSGRVRLDASTPPRPAIEG